MDRAQLGWLMPAPRGVGWPHSCVCVLILSGSAEGWLALDASGLARVMGATGPHVSLHLANKLECEGDFHAFATIPLAQTKEVTWPSQVNVGKTHGL